MDTPSKKEQPRDDDGKGEWIYVRFFRHYRTGKLIYPKNGGWFRFRRRR